MADLFRKSLLDKISSPEQLDKMIVVTSPDGWVGIAGAGAVVIAVLTWSIFGRIPVKQDFQGIYGYEAGVFSVYSEQNGIITDIEVKNGEKIQKGDRLASIDTTEIDQQIAEYQTRIEHVAEVTLTSDNDIITADNKSMMDVKNELVTLSQSLQQDQALLQLKREQLAKEQAEADTAEKRYLETEKAYFDSLNIDDVTDVQLEYSNAQSDYSNARSLTISAEAARSQAELQHRQAVEKYNAVLKQYQELTAQLEVLDPSDPAFAAVQEQAAAYEEALAQADEAVNSAQLSVDEAVRQLNQSEEDEAAAKTAYENAKGRYVSASGSTAREQQNQSKLGNEYNTAMSDYKTGESTVKTIREAVEQLEAQILIDQNQLELQKESITNQFTDTKEALLSQLRQELDQLERRKDQLSIRSTVDGTISEIAVTKGSAVGQGTVIAKIRQDSSRHHAMICYAPIATGKKVKPGMEVLIYPTTVNRQEYGHMTAVVESVDQNVTSMEQIQLRLGSDSLAQSFGQNGPVVEIICQMTLDENTASGYYWSSQKAKDITLENNTIAELSVITEEKAPISMLIPYLKDKLVVEPKEQ